MINPLFNDSKTHRRLRERADTRVAARKELDRITSASLTSLKSNFESPDELEETIKKLEKQITTKSNNKARLVGAMKRVNNMKKQPLTRGMTFRRAGLLAMATKKNNNGLESHPLAPVAVSKTRGFASAGVNKNKEAREQVAKNITVSAIASIIKKNRNTENRRAQERAEFNKKKYQKMIENGETISESDRKRIELLYNNLAKELNKRNAVNKTKKEAAAEKKAANNAKAAEEKKAANNVKAAAEKKAANNAKAAAEKKAANNAKAAAEKKAANNAKAAVISERNARNALKKYLEESVKPTYNKALVNAILRLPKENLNNNTRRRLQSPRMYALKRGAGALGRGAVTAGGALGRGAVTAGGALGRGAVTAGGALGRGAVTAGGALGRGAVTAGGALGRGAGGFFSRLFAPKPVGATGPPSFIPFKKGMKIPFGYVLRRNNKNKGLGYYMNNKGLALSSQLEHRGYGPAPKPASGTTTGVSIGVGPGPRNRNSYGNNYGYGYGNRGGGAGAPSIVFSPKINVGAARIGAQTFGGTRVGGQTMGGSRATTGNVSGSRVTTGNAGRLTVSAPTTNGNRRVANTSEQLIRSAGGAEAVEQGIEALRKANGNVTRAKAASKLPNNTFTNIYAMGGPNAAKRIVEQRRRRRRGTGSRGGPTKKKRVAQKPRKQYIKLTPYQFRRLTDHIKKNNLRKVLIKEITH
jgi:hypothetical protein